MFQPHAAAKDKRSASRSATSEEHMGEAVRLSRIPVGLGRKNSSTSAFSSYGGRTLDRFVRLRGAMGNQATLRLLSRPAPALQTKLAINQPGDQYEQEADRVADQVMRMPQPAGEPPPPNSSGGGKRLQRKCACGGSDTECESCKKKEQEEGSLQRKSSSASPRTEAPAIVHDVLASPGQAMDPATRNFFEPRFGRSFADVKLHSGDKAHASASAVNALAYTVGSNIVFGSGQYSPSSTQGRQLLAHELTHVAQQSDPSVTPQLSRAWNGCDDPPECPKRELGEQTRAASATLQVAGLDAPEVGEIVFGFNIGSSNTSSLRSNPLWNTFAAGIVASSDRWEILGFTDCEGGVERNTQLRDARAKAALAALPPAAQAKVDNAAAAALTDCVASNDTEANRAFNRSVVFRKTVSVVTFGDQPVQGITCPPKTGAGATSLADYIALLTCAETQTGFGPRDMLAVLRQIYYGKPWSTVSKTSKWDNVIPCSPNIGDPSSKLGANLFHALGAADEIEGVDVGHVFTGLESMTCPSSNVTFFAGLGTVDMSSEEFATWGGDLGAAVAPTAACPALGPDAAKSEDCGHTTGSQPLSFYWALSAPDQDLEGDIDAFVMRATILGIPCSGSAGRTFTPTDPMSKTFAQYYINTTSALGAARPNSHRCLLEILGATFSGKSVTNRSTIKPPIVPRVASFARAFYTKIKGGFPPSTPDMGERILILDNSDKVTDLFLDYLIRKL